MTATAIAAKIKAALGDRTLTRADMIGCCEASPMQIDGAIRWLRKAGAIRRIDGASGPGVPATYQAVVDYRKQRAGGGVWAIEGLEERMVVLFGQGLSCTQIARALAAEHRIVITRNAVIGKLSRLGLTREKPSKPAARTHAPKVVTFRAKPKAALRPALPTPSLFPPTQVRQLVVASACAPKPLTELRPRMCKWAVNDGEDPRHGFLFCSADALEGPYCHQHTGLAYRPPPANLSVTTTTDSRRFNGRTFAGGGPAHRFAE